MDQKDSFQGGISGGIEKVSRWHIDKGTTGAALLSMPNIPKALHKLAPLTLLGDKAWRELRSKCLKDAHYTCEACGRALVPSYLDAHELYTYNYYDCVAVFERCVCLCKTCHASIHSGHILTRYMNHELSKAELLNIIENQFRLICAHNDTHKNSKPLKVYKSIMRCYDIPDLKDAFEKLVDKYHIEFYGNEWQHGLKRDDWNLIVFGVSLKPHSNEELERMHAQEHRVYQPSYVKEA